MQLHLVRKNWSVSSSACIISDYSNKSVFLVLTLTVEYKMFWLGRRAPNISFRFLEHATSMYGMFNGDSGKGTPLPGYMSSIFITSCWWWWFCWIWGSYHHHNTLITHMRLDTICSKSRVGWLLWSIRSLYWLGLKDEVHGRKSQDSLQLLQQLGSTFLVVTSLVKTRGVSR